MVSSSEAEKKKFSAILMTAETDISQYLHIINTYHTWKCWQWRPSDECNLVCANKKYKVKGLISFHHHIFSIHSQLQMTLLNMTRIRPNECDKQIIIYRLFKNYYSSAVFAIEKQHLDYTELWQKPWRQ